MYKSKNIAKKKSNNVKKIFKKNILMGITIMCHNSGYICFKPKMPKLKLFETLMLHFE